MAKSVKFLFFPPIFFVRVCVCVFCYRNVDKTTGHVKRQQWTPVPDYFSIPKPRSKSSRQPNKKATMFTSRGNGTGPLSAGLTLKWFRAIRCPWLADCTHLLLLNLLPLDTQYSGCLRDSVQGFRCVALHMTSLRRMDGQFATRMDVLIERCLSRRVQIFCFAYKEYFFFLKCLRCAVIPFKDYNTYRIFLKEMLPNFM